jgi:hypothetical protein
MGLGQAIKDTAWSLAVKRWVGQVKEGKMGAQAKRLWTLLDGHKSWIMALWAAAEAYAPGMAPTHYIDVALHAIGWDRVAPAIDPGLILFWVGLAVAVGHRLLKAYREYGAGVPLAQVLSHLDADLVAELRERTAARRPRLVVPPGSGPALLVLLCLVMPPALRADEPAPRPPVTVTVQAGAELPMSPAGSKVTPSARISVDGPLVLGAGKPRGIVGATVDILGLPGASATPELAALDTWTSIRAEGSMGVSLGDLEQAGQHVQTRILVHGGFANRFGKDPEPVSRTAREYGIAVELRELVGGARLRVGIGHDDAVSEAFGHGHLLVSGSVPIAGTHGIAALGAEAALALGHVEGVSTTDRVTVRILFSPPRSGPSAATPPASARLEVAARTRTADLTMAAPLTGPPSPGE